jgi:hypothetical protein
MHGRLGESEAQCNTPPLGRDTPRDTKTRETLDFSDEIAMCSAGTRVALVRRQGIQSQNGVCVMNAQLSTSLAAQTGLCFARPNA